MKVGPSVRNRSLAGMTVLLSVLGLGAALIAYSIDQADANRLLDDELRLIAFYAAPGLSHRVPLGRAFDESHDVLVQFRDSAGRLISSSDRDIAVPASEAEGFANPEVGGKVWRSYSARTTDGIVQVSQSVNVRRRLARTAAWEAATPVIVTIPIGWLVVGFGLRLMLRSLARLSAAIAARGVEARAPIALVGVPDEFSPLVGAMNALIERLQVSLEQQRQFLSDAAHELRTPLMAVRLQIELLRAGDQGDAALDVALPELARGAGRASALVDQLLRMARYDAGVRTEEPALHDLVELVVACMADFVALAESKGIDLGLVASKPARLFGVERDLRLLIANLIENAVRYTPEGGVVDVGVRTEDGRVLIEVADTGPGIPETLLLRVFDRFFRAPDAGAEGTGLGLAICRAIAHRHGLALTLANRPGGGLLATVSGRGQAPA